MRTTRVWARLLDLGAAVVEEVNFGDEGEVVVAAPPQTRAHMWLASLVPSSLVPRDDESDLVGAAELLDLQARVVHDDRVDLVQAADAREVRGSRL